MASTRLAEQTGVQIVPVAAGGTGVTQQHLQALRDATGRDLRDLIVALDPDTPGRTAAARVWQAVTPQEAAHAQALELSADAAQIAHEAPSTLAKALAGRVPLAWFAMEPNLQRLRSVDHFDQQIPLLRALVDYLYDRVEPLQWPDLVDHIARTVGDTPGAKTHGQLDVPSVREVVTDHLVDRILPDAQTSPNPDLALDTDPVGPGHRETTAVRAPQTDPLVAAWLVRHADLADTRLDTLVQDALIDPQLWMETITPSPPTGPAREPWLAALRQVLAYRDRYQITDPVRPLGPEAGEGGRGDSRAIADRALDAITSTDTRTRLAPRPARPRPRPMERAPVVLAEARASAARPRREADERARHDRAERERDRAIDRSW